MAKKRSGKNRSQQKIQDAFQLAERAEARGGRGANQDPESESDQDDELPVKEGVLDARKFLKDQDNDSDLDDEDLDSDEALGSEDEFDVLNSKFSQTIRDKQKEKKSRRGMESESSEEDEGYDSIDESQLVTLSEAWDMDDKDMAGGKGKSKAKDVVLDDVRESESEEESDLEGQIELKDESGDSGSDGESESGSGSASESESGSEDESESESENEEDIFGGFDDEDVDLKSTLSTVNSKVKAPNEYRRLIHDSREASEFALPTRGEKLSLAEMLSGAGEEADDAYLINREEESKPVAVPLPKRIQTRNDRRAAYEITKEEVNKWKETVRTLQEADHLEFPLAPPATAEEQEEIDPEKEYDALRFVPETESRNELENKIHGLLEAGALVDESKEATFEQIAVAKLSKEDMFKRTQELRRMRELMFRDEQRAKRIKKIKSKQYRKIKKKERLRDAQMVEGSDAESDPEDHDMKRAEERMSQKHKTQSSWAKQMIKSGISKDSSSRAQLEEMLRDGERLRAKQLGHDDGGHSDDGISDIEKDIENDQDNDAEREKLGKGIMAMDFMKNAEDRKRRENKKELEFLRGIDSSTGIEEFEGLPSEKNSINKLKNEGRRMYAPKVAAEKEEMEELDEELIHDYRDDEANNLENRLKGKTKGRERTADEDEGESDEEDQPPSKKHKVEEKEESDFEGFGSEKSNSDDNDDDEDDDEENPWLMAGDDQQTSAKSKKFSTVTEDSSKLSKAANKIEKHKNKANKSKGSKEPSTLIDMKKVIDVSGKNDAFGSDDDQSDEEDETDGRMFKQSSLIKEAFAGDDVVSEFQEEKRRLIEEEDDKEEDMTLPGWGSWGGDDKPQKPKKKFVRKVDGVARKDTRQDKNKDNVIINEKLNKHNLKYQSANVPHPYETREQYERALRMPIGEEWASRATFQKSTLPRVIVKQGTVVDPLKAPFK
ncbi:hypothetical protein FT663_01625 [Candidozyma haemuli var. vulneris]|uniref:U3 small nucleolar RNA-associated protein 14 n=1 Tax=Candidozyma haemuli TaxID=45357 RepID=A0A2V1B1U8_9ASCO|nr:hypothetical protein CXQ85_004127 [[Candida] haemuloni]KAF3994125.1 hypothetical protein FT663_01625 [[Candida] haemuloni var. vulneris]KAF3994291.1 hypothetical protein FT662_00160 [[Candida] haemuloni var. vulneris]PVH23833.1 hypothetical protein CXQ85_004127 [[Candida] haemuloni]